MTMYNIANHEFAHGNVNIESASLETLLFNLILSAHSLRFWNDSDLDQNFPQIISFSCNYNLS